MAAWVHEWLHTDLTPDCARISAPTLVITGEPHLDHVVPASSSLDYLTLIPGARHQILSGTGHMGSVTRPDMLTDLIDDFVRQSEGSRGHAH